MSDEGLSDRLAECVRRNRLTPEQIAARTVWPEGTVEERKARLAAAVESLRGYQLVRPQPSEETE
jgi:hypothetical protein